jgi:hypothetical protein
MIRERARKVVLAAAPAKWRYIANHLLWDLYQNDLQSFFPAIP